MPSLSDNRLAQLMPRVLLIGGVVAVVIYYVIAVGRGADGRPASSETDAFGLMQYARAIAEGHPYVFASSDGPSTGSTSHLYPAMLAILYRLGAHGDTLITAAFALNAILYLIWLQLFWMVAKACARRHPACMDFRENREAVLAAGLALLNGHLLMTACGLTDIALFTTLAWGLFAALLYDRPRLAALLLILCVLTRPEGIVLALGLSALGILRAMRHDPGSRRTLGIALCGFAAVCAVFALNYTLTGFAQFQSVAPKGYLKNFPLISALGCAARDFGLLVREILFNSGTVPRQAYFLPVIGGLLAVAGLTGIFHSRDDNKSIVQWWLGCSLAAFGLVALSEWQGASTDRYFLWLLPTWYLLAAGGAGQVAEASHNPRVFTWLAVLLLGYELVGGPYFAALYGKECVQAQAVANFARTVESQLPAQASVGVISGASVSYELGRQRPIQHLAGIVTRAFARQRDMLCAFEMLKHHPEYRFSHLVITASEQTWCDNAGLLGEVLLTDLDAPPDGRIYALCTARWEAFSAAALHPLNSSVSKAVAGWKLVDQLDVGYMPDERRCRYQVGSRLPDQICRPCVASRTIGGLRVTEVGQPVIGWDEFHVHSAQPGHPMRVVMRTQLDATCMVVRATDKFADEGIHLRSPIQIRPIVNGRTLPLMTLPVATDPDTFSECILDLPGEVITTDPLEIVFAGDHIAMAYWFYQ